MKIINKCGYELDIGEKIILRLCQVYSIISTILPFIALFIIKDKIILENLIVILAENWLLSGLVLVSTYDYYDLI